MLIYDFYKIEEDTYYLQGEMHLSSLTFFHLKNCFSFYKVNSNFKVNSNLTILNDPYFKIIKNAYIKNPKWKLLYKEYLNNQGLNRLLYEKTNI